MYKRQRQSLTNSNYFKTVVVTPHLRPNSINVPITVRLALKKTKRYALGLGYGTDTGPRAILGFNWVPSNFNGHKLSINLRGSKKNNTYLASYTIPGANPTSGQYILHAGLIKEITPRGDGRSKSIGFSYNKGWGQLQQVIQLKYIQEHYTLDYLPNNSSDILAPSIQWSYKHIKGSLNPVTGYKINLMLTGGDKRILSKTSFFQAMLSAHYLYTFRATHTRLLGRTRIGHTAIGNIVHLPLTLQLLAGGSQSIRGYEFNSIGPGKNIFVTSIELQQNFYNKWYIGAFYDTGNVSNNPLGNLLKGAGPCLVWLSPVGTLELSLGKALNNPHSKWMIHFSMGALI